MDKRQYSVNLSRALDALGFSYNCIKYRQKSWEMFENLTSDESKHLSFEADNITVLIAGSKAEGLSRLLEGDTDLMLSLNDFICYGSEKEMESNMLTSMSIEDLKEIKNESPELLYRRGGQFKKDENESKDHYRTELKQSSFEFNTVKAKNHVTDTDEKDEKLGEENTNDLQSETVAESLEQLQDLTKNPRESNFKQANKTKNIKYDGVFLMDTKNVAAGYAILKVVHLDENFNGKEGEAIFVHAQMLRDGETIISSEQFLSKNYEEDEDTATIAGPALRSFRDESIGSLWEIDAVFSIPCICKRINHAWVSRKRKFDWPSKELIAEISKLDGHVVPVGFKGSHTSGIEWRICYTLAEIKLVQSFNETQIKLHALLKIVGKRLLQTKCSDITSYILKNIILWMTEKMPTEKFQTKNLFGLLRVALKFLKQTIQKRCLPNYMIQERNLYDGKLTENERINVIKVLDELICGKNFIENYKELELLSKYIHIATCKPDLIEYMDVNRLQLESTFRQYSEEIWYDSVYNFVPVCLETCISLKSLVILSKLLGVNSKTKEMVVKRVFWWLTGWKERDDINNQESTNPFWSWSDSGDIISKSEQYRLSDERIRQIFSNS